MADRRSRGTMAGSMKVWVLGSGSRGNATVIDNGTTRVLVDAGFSSRELKRRLAATGIRPESIEGVIVTHEHGDHACGVGRAARRWKWTVHATRGTIENAFDLDAVEVRTFDAGATLTIGTMNLLTVPTSHDATDPVAVVATDVASGARAAVVVDLGRATVQLRNALRDVEVLVLESNHDEALLAQGPYPISVQRRIASITGHLSNRDAGRFARACAHSGLQHLVLAHLSEECNTPDHVLASASAALARSGFRGHISAAAQDTVRGAFIASRRGGRTVQLALGL
jgi:phosphoribosyl 1,2-cyclic phosphodiesterase